jgi:chromosome segregation ATPase
MIAGLFHFARQPGWIAIVVMALVGWALAIWSYSSSAQRSAALRQELQQLEASRDAALTEADDVRRSAGTAAALEKQAATARGDLDFLKRQQDRVGTELTRLREAIEAARQRQAALQGEIQAQTARAAEFRTGADRAAERLRQVGQDLDAAEKALEARTRELDTVVAQVESRRNEIEALERRKAGLRERDEPVESEQTGAVLGGAASLSSTSSAPGILAQETLGRSVSRQEDYRCVRREPGWVCSPGE